MDKRCGSRGIRSKDRPRRHCLGGSRDERSVGALEAAAVKVDPHDLLRPSEKPREELPGSRATAHRRRRRRRRRRSTSTSTSSSSPPESRERCHRRQLEVAVLQEKELQVRVARLCRKEALEIEET